MQEPAWTPCFVLLLLAAPASFTSTEGDLRPCQKALLRPAGITRRMETHPSAGFLRVPDGVSKRIQALLERDE
ncbi:hypothetical protein FQA47_010730 [Oryzias melastigma]|uniref:Uncharacterized protein n=1 Tax=Oryzias melastigma TaxID=30732 RepID=A0A834C8E2_ORYME|nr:hypothetical protein FQA47_010730 [Oryzias melastigma]